MQSDQAWKIIESNLPKLFDLIVTIQRGQSVDVFCDATGRDLSFSKPSPTANIKLCSVTFPDLDGCYGLHISGNSFVNDDGENILRENLAAYLSNYVANAKDEGAEWGWEFKLS